MRPTHPGLITGSLNMHNQYPMEPVNPSWISSGPTARGRLGRVSQRMRQAVFTLVTRGRYFLTSASKFYVVPNGGIVTSDCASPNVQTPSVTRCMLGTRVVLPGASRAAFLCVDVQGFSTGVASLG